MALRVRADGRILCAAKCEPMDGDIYIDDALHSYLTRCTRISVNIIESLGEDEHGQEEWVFINDSRHPGNKAP